MTDEELQEQLDNLKGMAFANEIIVQLLAVKIGDLMGGKEGIGLLADDFDAGIAELTKWIKNKQRGIVFEFAFIQVLSDFQASLRRKK